MSVCSALKKAALFIPREIAAGYRLAKMGLRPSRVPPVTRGVTHIEDEAVGPFVSTGIKDGKLGICVTPQHFVSFEDLEQRGLSLAEFLARGVTQVEDAQREPSATEIRRALALTKIERLDRALALKAPTGADVDIRDPEQVDSPTVDMLARGVTHIEDEKNGPFQSTVVAKFEVGWKDKVRFFLSFPFRYLRAPHRYTKRDVKDWLYMGATVLDRAAKIAIFAAPALYAVGTPLLPMIGLGISAGIILISLQALRYR